MNVIKKGCLNWISDNEFVGYDSKPCSKIVCCETSSKDNKISESPTIFFINDKKYGGFSPIFSYGFKDAGCKFIPFCYDGPKYYSFSDLSKVKRFIGCTKVVGGMILIGVLGENNSKTIFYFWDEKNCLIKPIYMKISKDCKYIKASPQINDSDAVFEKKAKSNNWYNPDSYVYKEKDVLIFDDNDINDNLYKKKNDRIEYIPIAESECDIYNVLTEQSVVSGNSKNTNLKSVWNHKPKNYEDMVSGNKCISQNKYQETKTEQKCCCKIKNSCKCNQEDEILTTNFFELISKELNCVYNKSNKYNVTLECVTSVPSSKVLILGFVCARKIILVTISYFDCTNFVLCDNFKHISFDICDLAKEYKLPKNIVQSINLEDILYDPKNNTVIILTSHINKSNEEEGGYIWCVKWFSRFKTTSLFMKPAMLNKTKSGNFCPRDLNCYPCSMTKLGKEQGKLMVIYDKHQKNKFYFEIFKYK
jgi:hypothetical protein